ncbi:MAG TPA: class I SAM-dependent methyltransferase [Polyangiales bacterium]|jgi:ubiquinone/menaquinone biosynthesis methyltransferase|nr:class I SAM-dependent methyltransferase [Polyangiales bacterium]
MDLSIADHTQRLADDFDRVADRYDLLQRFNPGYTSDLRRSAKRLGAPPNGRLLDLCCGTGLSTEALRREYPAAEITAVDNSVGMLASAKTKASLDKVRFVVSDAMALQHSDARGNYDGILMAYGIRNVTDPDRCLAALRDQLAPGGRLALHEYSVAGSIKARAIWNVIAASVIVPLGAALTGSPSLFRYLRQSVNDFDSIEQLESRLRNAGFIRVRSESMPGWRRGIVHTVLAERA